MTDIIQIQESEYDAILRHAVAVIDKTSNGGNNGMFCHRYRSLGNWKIASRQAESEEDLLEHRTDGRML